MLLVDLHRNVGVRCCGFGEWLQLESTQQRAHILSASLLVQYNCDFDLDLIEMSLRIYSCVSLIVPLSSDVVLLADVHRHTST